MTEARQLLSELLPDLQALVSHLEDDLRQRVDEVPEVAQVVDREYERAKKAGRTGDSRATFRDHFLTQAAVSWVLAAVFVRFLEDNAFLDDPKDAGGEASPRRWIAGHDLDYLGLAREAQAQYFQEHPHHGEREYLLHVFGRVAELPGMDRLLGRGRTLLWDLGLSADGARDLLEAFRRRDPATGAVAHVFRQEVGEGEPLDTRFLGDLYQDLSEAARKRYALLQTPEFVEEFILDRTLDPAIDEFGHDEVRVLDPACGSGHFLLGAFDRLLDLAQAREPAVDVRELVQRVLRQVHGVDLNPYAAAIARFRLLVAALRAVGESRLAVAPDFEIRVATGDALLHGYRPATTGANRTFEEMASTNHYYATEDEELLDRVIGQPFHVVVANPPYVTVKDKGLNQEYRELYVSCYRRYSLVCPFLERIFDLGISPEGPESSPAGFVGVIVGNSFMKRQFGKKMIEELVPEWDLTAVVDTSGAYIPAHGTPTVMLFGRSRRPVDDEVRAVLGIRGEPTTPGDPAQGKVWQSITRLVNRPGSENDYVSVEDVPRIWFHEHPWSLQGGGASQLKSKLEEEAVESLDPIIEDTGFMAITGEDEFYVLPPHVPKRLGLPSLAFGTGENVRDWIVSKGERVVFPHTVEMGKGLSNQVSPDRSQALKKFFWRGRTRLSQRVMFGKTAEMHGNRWFDFMQLIESRVISRHLIPFAFVATHNHFVLDRGGKVFNRSAPVIRLPEDATEDEHLKLLGLLNSSVACFWMKQVFHNKGATSHKGVLQDDPERFRFEFDGTKLSAFPIPELSEELRDALIRLAAELDSLGAKISEPLVPYVSRFSAEPEPLRANFDALLKTREEIRQRMVSLQEELDWLCYEAYGLLESPGRARSRALEGDLADLEPQPEGDRLYRRLDEPDLEASLPEVEKARLDEIRHNQSIRLCEKPEYKRRWFRSAGAYNEENLTDEMLLQRALREWILDRLEAPELWSKEELTTTSRLADRLRHEEAFRRVVDYYTGERDARLEPVVRELALEESVPYLAEQRFKASGLRKYEEWKETWELQRREDEIDARQKRPKDHPDHLGPAEAKAKKAEEVGEIPVPPKYRKSDFASGNAWKHRGKLDVPKERFLHLPGAEREADPTPVLAWAGWNHLQLAQALATYYVQAKETEGWPAERLRPLLQGLRELLPWLRQWHDDVDPAYGMGMGEYFAGFVEEEERSLGVD